ncbi:MAG: hypothetical protein IJM45_09685 [Clostridia bacterium]|nr:hypothetical protein [Clostridia bacterium]
MNEETSRTNTLKRYVDAGVPFSKELFERGDTALAPVLCWEWLRYPSAKEARRQLDAAKKAGFGAVYILPMPRQFRPDTMVTELDGYLTKRFFAKVRSALAYADKIGLRLWLYDEGGWPSGSACGKVVKEMPDRTLMRLSLDENGEPVLVPRSGKPDIYDEDVARRFTRLTHRSYAEALGELGSRVEAMFTDEPAGSADAVSGRLLTEFRKKYGYDMEPYLSSLLSPDDSGEDGVSARRDRYALLCERFTNTLEIYRRADHENGWLSVGHLDRDHTADSCLSKGYGNTLRALKALDIPGVDAIGGQIHSQGNLLDGNAAAFYPRFASSAAVQNGTALALSESFAVYGNALSGDEMRYVVNYQLVRGINLFNFMTMPSTMADWYAFSERPYFHPDIPGFYALDSLCAEIERGCLFMATGLHAAETALWYPHGDIVSGGKQGEHAIKAFIAAGNALEAAGVDYDLIDDATVLESPVKNGLLHAGGAAYAEIVIPDGCTLPEAVREKIKALKGKARAFAACTEPSFIHRTNRDANGDLHVCVFNQSRETKTAKVRVDTDKPVYLCDPKTGAFYLFDNGGEITLACGQCALLLATDDRIDCASECRQAGEIVLRPVSANKTAEFRLSGKGAELAPVDGGLQFTTEKAAFPAGFCGEAAYVYSFFSEEPGDCILSVTSLEYFAEVFLNGERVGSVCTAPYSLKLDRRYINAGKNKLTIRIANLAAVAYARTDDYAFFEKKYVGPYHDTTLEFEREVSGGGFGGLRLERLR